MKQKIHINSFYYGSSVLLISTEDKETGEINLAPVSSSFALGTKLIVGIVKGSKTYHNLRSGSDASVSLPDGPLWDNVERLGKLTGNDTLSDNQRHWGVMVCTDKFAAVGLHPEPAESITPPGVSECPIRAECRLLRLDDRERFALAEFDIIHTWVTPHLAGTDGQLKSSDWHPLIYVFREYATTGQRLGMNFKHGH
ncbi:flavin reductase [Klebsiella aerogenes]|nr:flavin reductase [Klebsiella aerogenes]ELY3087838.1 flavin reductase [Klebsiella aerogenes]